MKDEATPDRTTILIQFGLMVRKIRQTQGLSQERLAHLCELDRTYIGGIERGERNIGLINVYKISKSLNVPVGMLFQEIEMEK